MGFHVHRIRRDKYIINKKTIIILKYSQIYPDQNITWFGLKESLFYENEVDFVFFIIDNSNNVLVTPFKSIQDIPKYVNLAASNSTYEIHIDPVNYNLNETNKNLNLYLNNYSQLL
jgi:hypothetical protein